MSSPWPVQTLAEVCNVVNGGTPKTGIVKYWGGPHQWITPAEMGRRASPYVDETERTLTDAGLDNSSARLLPAKSVILSSRAPIGHLVINTVPMATNQGCKGLVPGRGLDYRFLYHYLFSIREQLEAMGTGATFKELSGARLKEVRIPVPPLPEQRRIVAILDEAFAAIATAKANAEKNLQNARAVFESERELLLGRDGSKSARTTIGDHVDILTGFPFKSAKYTEKPEDVRLLRGDNIVQGALRWRDVMRWPSTDAVSYEKFFLANGDVVLAMDRPWVKAGLKHAQLSSDDLPCLLVQRTARLRCKRSLRQRYLMYLVGSQAFTWHLLGVQTGIGVPHISAQQIKDFVFAVPSPEEQDRIVGRLDALADCRFRLEHVYGRKLAALAALKSSLLHHAFTGQLTSAKLQEACSASLASA